jgi:DMSO reductase anchor subunit
MNPAFSVVFLTTLIGAAQGLLFALVGAEWAGRYREVAMPDHRTFFALGCVIVIVLAALGLVASFFHLGRPERAWRAASQWRTSWLSREVIVLPAFIAAAFVYGLAQCLSWRGTAAYGTVAAVLAIALFVCTGMIYACLRFLQEWASPLTVVNFFVLGSASGLTLASAFSAIVAPHLAAGYAWIAAGVTLLGLVTRSWSLIRNARLRPKSTLQTAIGVRHPRIVQKAQGSMGGSFNTREFFHGKTPAFLRRIKWIFVLLAFILPIVLLVLGNGVGAYVIAFAIQFVGLIAERWFFLAQANHPQNLYYQAIS